MWASPTGRRLLHPPPRRVQWVHLGRGEGLSYVTAYVSFLCRPAVTTQTTVTVTSERGCSCAPGPCGWWLGGDPSEAERTPGDSPQERAARLRRGHEVARWPATTLVDRPGSPGLTGGSKSSATHHCSRSRYRSVAHLLDLQLHNLLYSSRAQFPGRYCCSKHNARVQVFVHGHNPVSSC